MTLSRRTMLLTPVLPALLSCTGYRRQALKTENNGPLVEPGPLVLPGFLRLADHAVRPLVWEPPNRAGYKKNPGLRDYYMFFVDSYAVRALDVAYDLTGRERYWRACRSWTDRMVRHQEKMVPAGAYYMNYGRKPGGTQGEWFVADSGSIGMAVLATALRSKDLSRRERYLNSVKAYLELVMEKFVQPSGGVTDGYWHKSDKEWWCSTALFAACALQFYGVAGGEKLKTAALAAIDWLLNFEYGDTILYKFEDGAPTTIFYILEAYSSALPHLEPGSRRQRRIFERFSQTVEWIADRQNRQGGWNYSPDNWGIKLGGLPCHLLIYLRCVPDTAARERKCISRGGDIVRFEQLVARSAKRALNYFASQPSDPKIFEQRDAFTLLSAAEALCPGELYQKTTSAFPYKRYTKTST